MPTKLFSRDAQSHWEYAGALSASVDQLGDFLDDAFGDGAVVLHDRLAPNSPDQTDRSGTDHVGTDHLVIDHLVIAASGVWVIDARCGDDADLVRALLESETAGTSVGHRLRMELIDAIHARRDATAALLEPMGLRSVPVHPVACITEQEWSRTSMADVVHDVLVLSPDKLRSVACQPGWLDAEAIEAIALRLRSALVPNSRTH